MFTRKKSLFKRKGFYITLVAMLSIVYMLGSLIAAPEEVNQVDVDNEKVNISTNAKQKVEQDNCENNTDFENNYDDFENSAVDSNNNVQENQSSEYYLVKESDGLIKVYKYDKEGEEELLRTTDILYSLLSEDDQQLFSKGYKLETEEELLELLQDFES